MKKKIGGEMMALYGGVTLEWGDELATINLCCQLDYHFSYSALSHHTFYKFLNGFKCT